MHASLAVHAVVNAAVSHDLDSGSALSSFKRSKQLKASAKTSCAEYAWCQNDTMRFDKAYGAVLGAFVGDAAGAVLEFRPRPDLARVRNCTAHR